jgi:hypothetical protein
VCVVGKYAAGSPDGDSSKQRVAIVFQAVAPATADTLLTLTKYTEGVAGTPATSIGVATGKRMRICSVTFSLKANAAAAAFGTLTVRQNPTGATVIGSASEMRVDVGNTEAVAGAARSVTVPFPDGSMEFTGAATLGASLAAQAVTNIVSISFNGYEY